MEYCQEAPKQPDLPTKESTKYKRIGENGLKEKQTRNLNFLIIHGRYSEQLKLSWNIFHTVGKSQPNPGMNSSNRAALFSSNVHKAKWKWRRLLSDSANSVLTRRNERNRDAGIKSVSNKGCEGERGMYGRK